MSSWVFLQVSSFSYGLVQAHLHVCDSSVCLCCGFLTFKSCLLTPRPAHLHSVWKRPSVHSRASCPARHLSRWSRLRSKTDVRPVFKSLVMVVSTIILWFGCVKHYTYSRSYSVSHFSERRQWHIIQNCKVLNLPDYGFNWMTCLHLGFRAQALVIRVQKQNLLSL